jgi:hypothetical protein
MSEILLNQGSDLQLSCTLTDTAGAPLDLTGHGVDLFAQHPKLGASVTVINAAQGQIQISAPHSADWPLGAFMTFRLRLTAGGVNTTFPEIRITLQ